MCLIPLIFSETHILHFSSCGLQHLAIYHEDKIHYDQLCGMHDQKKICEFINCSATCGLQDAGTKNSTNLIQVGPQPTIPHSAGCGVPTNTNQTKTIGTSQPAFRTLRDAGFRLIKINTYTNYPAPHICRMRDVGLKMKYQMKGLPHSASCGFEARGMLKQSKQKFIIPHSKQRNKTKTML